jgi:hypothetical protein
MKKSTLVRVSTNLRAKSIEYASTLYFSDGDYTAWVDFSQCKGDILIDAYLTIAKEVLSCDGLLEREVSSSCLDGKIRDYFLIRIVLLLGIALEHHCYTRDDGFFSGQAFVGRPRSTSVRNLMLLKYQKPSTPGEPLYEVHQG